MRRAFAASLLVALCATLCAARGQTAGEKKEGRRKSRPDLTGTWLPDPTGDANIQDRPGGSKTLRLVIRHAEPEIKISRVNERDGAETARESVYYTDGRGETNPAPAITTTPDGEQRLEDVKSKTKWDGEKLVVRSTMRVRAAGAFLNVTMVEEWKLAPDGQTLTQRTTIKFEPTGGLVRPGEPGHTIVRSSPQEAKRTYRRAAT
ncbi:MAG TPA: hypothetical protein VFX96_14270 [Pyrinomonadaceae bacterium]|nr:hypothetical protein [Pyrinomonadaceae bacterium]